MKSRKFDNPSKILRVFCFTPITKPLNGTLPQSNKSQMLRLYPIEYTHKRGKKEKTEKLVTYFIKGLRGAIRHQVMRNCYENGLEVCHSSDKETDKHENSILPNGFHLLGSCQKNGECVVHQVFGSKGNEGLISIYADPIASFPHKTANPEDRVQNVHIAMENRNARAFDGGSILNFKEQYFSGNFTFEIDVSKCNETQLGLIIEVIMKLRKLGRACNSGYGRIYVKRFQLFRRYKRIFPEWLEDSFVVKEETMERRMKKDVFKALQAWHQYIKEEISNKCN